jgi:hypothetical protein
MWKSRPEAAANSSGERISVAFKTGTRKQGTVSSKMCYLRKNTNIWKTTNSLTIFL